MFVGKDQRGHYSHTIFKMTYNQMTSFPYFLVFLFFIFLNADLLPIAFWLFWLIPDVLNAVTILGLIKPNLAWLSNYFSLSDTEILSYMFRFQVAFLVIFVFQTILLPLIWKFFVTFPSNFSFIPTSFWPFFVLFLAQIFLFFFLARR